MFALLALLVAAGALAAAGSRSSARRIKPGVRPRAYGATAPAPEGESVAPEAAPVAFTADEFEAELATRLKRLTDAYEAGFYPAVTAWNAMPFMLGLRVPGNEGIIKGERKPTEDKWSDGASAWEAFGGFYEDGGARLQAFADFGAQSLAESSALPSWVTTSHLNLLPGIGVDGNESAFTIQETKDRLRRAILGFERA